jgi:hypothetical protein
MGIEPTSEAWEASILPLYDARSLPERRQLYTTRASRVQMCGVRDDKSEDEVEGEGTSKSEGEGVDW